VNANRSSVASRSIASTDCRPSIPGDHPELFTDVSGIGLGEDRAGRRGHHLGVALRDLREDVAQEVHPAPLPGRAEQDCGDGLFEPGVGIGDDQLYPAEPTRLQRAQERGPERAVLAVADGEPEDLAPAVGPDTGGDHDRLGHHAVVHPRLAIGRVQEDVGDCCSASERPRNAPTSTSRSAQILLTSLLEIPVSAPSALTRSSTFRVDTPCR